MTVCLDWRHESSEDSLWVAIAVIVSYDINQVEIVEDLAKELARLGSRFVNL
jgi:hypothetical protein